MRKMTLGAKLFCIGLFVTGIVCAIALGVVIAM